MQKINIAFAMQVTQFVSCLPMARFIAQFLFGPWLYTIASDDTLEDRATVAAKERDKVCMGHSMTATIAPSSFSVFA
jgi:hypothetical protein